MKISVPAMPIASSTHIIGPPSVNRLKSRPVMVLRDYALILP